MDVLDTYCQTLLFPRLRKYGSSSGEVARICVDVRQRLTSLLSHWPDEEFRRTVLTIGIEEATFWEPRDADIQVRALVVLCVRNSLISELNAQVRGHPQVLPDEDMPALTKEAINFFGAVDLHTVTAAPAADFDIFGALPARFPNAWQCLAALSCLTGAEAACSWLQQKAEPLTLPTSADRQSTSSIVIANGMDASIDPDLAGALKLIQEGKLTVFYSDSFTRLTRNPEKLLKVVDHILRHSATWLSPNFVMSNSFVARRMPLIRQSHTQAEAIANLANRDGLGPRHKELLDLV